MTLNRKMTLQESRELAEANKLILNGLSDAEMTRTAECLHGHNWRDNVTVAECMEMARQIEKAQNK